MSFSFSFILPCQLPHSRRQCLKCRIQPLSLHSSMPMALPVAFTPKHVYLPRPLVMGTISAPQASCFLQFVLVLCCCCNTARRQWMKPTSCSVFTWVWQLCRRCVSYRIKTIWWGTKLGSCRACECLPGEVCLYRTECGPSFLWAFVACFLFACLHDFTCKRQMTWSESLMNTVMCVLA